MITKLCNVDQLPAIGTMKSFQDRSGLQICVATLADKTLTAFENRCPHQNAPLSAGELDGCHVVCPYHGWRFDTRTGDGESIADPGLQLYEIRQYEQEIFVRIPTAV